MLISLGIIIGLLIAVICMLSVRRFQPTIERTVKQAENFTKERGEVFTPDDDLEDLKVYLDSLPKE